MRTDARIVLAALLLFGVPASPPAAAGKAKDAHGIFTGEIKPVIYVSDVERSAPFYRDVLGFGFHGYAENEGGPFYAEMTAAATKFGLHEPTSERQKGMVGRQRLYFRVHDLPAHRARVVARGGEPGETRVTGWMDMFIVRDPDGGEVVFASTEPDRHPINPWNIEHGDAPESEDAPEGEETGPADAGMNGSP